MAAFQPRPTLVFVHGAFHDLSCFDLVRSQLAQYSYPSTAVSLPSTGASDPSKQTHVEDVAEIRKTLEHLIGREGKEVILVAHSYGGVLGSESLEGFARPERESNGKAGGVVACVFIAAALPLKGHSMRDIGKDWSFPYRHVKGDIIFVSSPEEHFYNDMSPATAAVWVSRLRDQSVASFVSKTEYVRWQLAIPLVYLVCTNDNAFSMNMQDTMLDRAGRERFMIARCATGHFPFLSRPEVVVEVIRKAAGESLGSGPSSHLEWSQTNRCDPRKQGQ